MSVAMDFFASQERARKKTSMLVFYYFLAVVLIILAVYSLFASVLTAGESDDGAVTFWYPKLFGSVALITLAVVGIGTAYKIVQLSGGGGTVALMLGGRPVLPGTTDADERMLLNIVEEMAIASGTPIPGVYILDNESGVNAFAAGLSLNDAVVAVTRGCLKAMNREQLQGVIAHEFSHILNGDMKLNLRLTGVLHGILLISLIGYWAMRVGMSSSRNTRSKDKGNALVLAIIVLGMLLWLIGSIGVLFGKLIKSAISRQREYLADASAVQFTRNPHGIGGALVAILKASSGSKFSSPNAEQASHFFFANGLARSWFTLMATHPPLKDRIHRIDPALLDPRVTATTIRQEPPPLPKGGFEAASGFAGANAAIAVNVDNVVKSVGKMDAAHLNYASGLLSRIPASMRARMASLPGARAVVYALLLSEENAVRDTQLTALTKFGDEEAYRDIKQSFDDYSALGAAFRLPLLDLAISTLRTLSRDEYKAFCRNVDTLVAADKEVDLFEYTLKGILKRRLDTVFADKKAIPVHYYTVKSLAPEITRLLSCLAYWGNSDQDATLKAFGAGFSKLNIEGDGQIVPAANCGLRALDESLEKIKKSTSFVRRRTLDACVACVGSDGFITVEEAELIRAVSDALECPMPPILPSSAAA